MTAPFPLEPSAYEGHRLPRRSPRRDLESPYGAELPQPIGQLLGSPLRYWPATCLVQKGLFQWVSREPTGSKPSHPSGLGRRDRLRLHLADRTRHLLPRCPAFVIQRTPSWPQLLHRFPERHSDLQSSIPDHQHFPKESASTKSYCPLQSCDCSYNTGPQSKLRPKKTGGRCEDFVMMGREMGGGYSS